MSDKQTALVVQAEQSRNPAALLQMAVQQGADIEKLTKLMELQERWEKNEARKAFDAAFAAFKAEAVKLLKNKTVNNGPLQGKSYAELHAVVAAVTPALAAHGLSSSWSNTKDEKDWIEVTCTVKHVGGHSESVSMGGPPDVGGAKNAIQARASTISYLQRYTLKAITGLAEQDDDDDGSGGSASHQDGEEDLLLKAGREASMEGVQALTKWWGGLTAKDRAKLNKEFGSLKRAAEQAERSPAHV